MAIGRQITDTIRSLREEFDKTFPNHNIDNIYINELNSCPSMISGGDEKEGDSLFNLKAHQYLMALMMSIALKKDDALKMNLKEAFERHAVEPRGNKKFTPDFIAIYKDMCAVLADTGLIDDPQDSDNEPDSDPNSPFLFCKAA